MKRALSTTVAVLMLIVGVVNVVPAVSAKPTNCAGADIVYLGLDFLQNALKGNAIYSPPTPQHLNEFYAPTPADDGRGRAVVLWAWVDCGLALPQIVSLYQCAWGATDEDAAQKCADAFEG